MSILTEMVEEADQELWRKPTSSDDPVLAMVKEGRVDAEIAVRLGISNAEVKERVERLVAKHGVKNRAELREPPAPVAVEEPVPVAVETTELERVSPVRAAAWAGAIALVVGVGVGWWIRDEQTEKPPEADMPLTDRVRLLDLTWDSDAPVLSAADTKSVAERARELRDAAASVPRTTTDIGIVFFGADETLPVVDSIGSDELDHRVVTLTGSASVNTAGQTSWSLVRRTTGEAEFSAKVGGKYFTLRLETANESTRIDRNGDIIRISSTDGSKPRVKLWVEGALWSFGLDGRLVVYL